MRELSKTTLLGRVHQQASLEASPDVDSLYQFIDPAIRARREREREDEPYLTLSELREFVSRIETAQVEEVEILEARKVSTRHGGRPAALVRSVIRYNHEAEPQRFSTIWVREGDTWYSTAIGKQWLRNKTLPEPGLLSDGVVRLELREMTPAIPEKGWVPAYHFTIVCADSGEPVGALSLRVGSSEALRLYAGHVGYEIAEPHRGHRYAARALALVAPLAWQNRIAPLWVTCNPENLASRRTCELAGAQYVATVDLPPESDMYARGERAKCRYRLVPPGSIGLS